MVDKNQSLHSSSHSSDCLSSIHSHGLQDLESEPQNLSFVVSKQEQTFIESRNNLSPSRSSYIPPQPGSAGIQRNPNTNAKHNSHGSKNHLLQVPQSMHDLSMTRQSIQLRQEQTELHQMMKQVHNEKAVIVKQQAVVEQQCQLLKLQLAEAHQRERTQSLVGERLQSALRQQITDAELKLQNSEVFKTEVDESHPKVKEILHYHLTQAQEKLHAERESFQQKIYQLERVVQQAKHDYQNGLRDTASQKSDYEQRLKTLDFELKKQEHQNLDEMRSLKERMQDRIGNLENEIEHLRAEEQTERYALFNKHIEQAAQLNNQIKKQARENQELQNQAKKFEIERDLVIEAKNDLLREIEMRQEDITELENALQDAQFQLQTMDSQYKQDIVKLQKESQKLLENNLQLQERVNLKDRQLSKAQRGNSSGRSVQKVNDYFSTTTQSLRKQGQHSNRSSSNTKVRQSQDYSRELSYTRMCKELEESMEVQDDSEKLPKLQQLVAHFRSSSKRLEVQLKDLKLKYHQDVEKLQTTIKTEKRRRAALYEEKIERSNQLLQQIGERDTTIFQLTKKLGSLQNNQGYGGTMIGTITGGPSTDLASEYTAKTQTGVKEPRDFSNKRRSTLQRSFNIESCLTEQPIARKESKPTLALKTKAKKQLIVKKLIKIPTEVPVFRLDKDGDLPSPFYLSEGSTTRLPITSTEKKLIQNADLPQVLQTPQSSRNDRIHQDSSEIVNYETQQIQNHPDDLLDKNSSQSSLQNEYYRIDGDPGALDKLQNFVQQNNAMLDMQHIFASDSPSRQPGDLYGGGPDLQNSLMSIAKMRYVETQSNERERADSLENSVHSKPSIIAAKPINARSGSTQQLPRRTSINSLAETAKPIKKKNQPNIPPKPVSISKKLTATPTKSQSVRILSLPKAVSKK